MRTVGLTSKNTFHLTLMMVQKMNDHTEQQFEKLEKSYDEQNDLQEGKLYVVQDGELKEIERDPDDTLKKIRIMDDAIRGATEVQKRLRKKMNGYKPDLSLVCSALIIAKSTEEDADNCVATLFAEMTRKLADA